MSQISSSTLQSQSLPDIISSLTSQPTSTIDIKTKTNSSVSTHSLSLPTSSSSRPKSTPNLSISSKYLSSIDSKNIPRKTTSRSSTSSRPNDEKNIEVALSADILDMPILDQNFNWFEWYTAMFPDSHPSSRLETVLLNKMFEKVLNYFQIERNKNVVSRPTTAAETFSKTLDQHILSKAECTILQEEWGCLNQIGTELVRQVGVHLRERGALLFQLLKRYDELIYSFSNSLGKETNAIHSLNSRNISILSKQDELNLDREKLLEEVNEKKKQLIVLNELSTSQASEIKLNQLSLKHMKDTHLKELSESEKKIKQMQENIIACEEKLHNLEKVKIPDIKSLLARYQGYEYNDLFFLPDQSTKSDTILIDNIDNGVSQTDFNVFLRPLHPEIYSQLIPLKSVDNDSFIAFAKFPSEKEAHFAMQMIDQHRLGPNLLQSHYAISFPSSIVQITGIKSEKHTSKTIKKYIRRLAEKYGPILRLCEGVLRGQVIVEFNRLEDSVKALMSLHGRRLFDEKTSENYDVEVNFIPSTDRIEYEEPDDDYFDAHPIIPEIKKENEDVSDDDISIEEGEFKLDSDDEINATSIPSDWDSEKEEEEKAQREKDRLTRIAQKKRAIENIILNETIIAQKKKEDEEKEKKEKEEKEKKERKIRIEEEQLKKELQQQIQTLLAQNKFLKDKVRENLDFQGRPNFQHLTMIGLPRNKQFTDDTNRFLLALRKPLMTGDFVELQDMFAEFRDMFITYRENNREKITPNVENPTNENITLPTKQTDQPSSTIENKDIEPVNKPNSPPRPQYIPVLDPSDPDNYEIIQNCEEKFHDIILHSVSKRVNAQIKKLTEQYEVKMKSIEKSSRAKDIEREARVDGLKADLMLSNQEQERLTKLLDDIISRGEDQAVIVRLCEQMDEMEKLLQEAQDQAQSNTEAVGNAKKVIQDHEDIHQKLIAYEYKIENLQKELEAHIMEEEKSQKQKELSIADIQAELNNATIQYKKEKEQLEHEINVQKEQGKIMKEKLMKAINVYKGESVGLDMELTRTNQELLILRENLAKKAGEIETLNENIVKLQTDNIYLKNQIQQTESEQHDSSDLLKKAEISLTWARAAANEAKVAARHQMSQYSEKTKESIVRLEKDADLAKKEADEAKENTKKAMLEAENAKTQYEQEIANQKIKTATLQQEEAEKRSAMEKYLIRLHAETEQYRTAYLKMQQEVEEAKNALSIATSNEEKQEALEKLEKLEKDEKKVEFNLPSMSDKDKDQSYLHIDQITASQEALKSAENANFALKEIENASTEQEIIVAQDKLHDARLKMVESEIQKSLEKFRETLQQDAANSYEMVEEAQKKEEVLKKELENAKPQEQLILEEKLKEFQKKLHQLHIRAANCQNAVETQTTGIQSAFLLIKETSRKLRSKSPPGPVPAIKVSEQNAIYQNALNDMEKKYQNDLKEMEETYHKKINKIRDETKKEDEIYYRKILQEQINSLEKKHKQAILQLESIQPPTAPFQPLITTPTVTTQVSPSPDPDTTTTSTLITTRESPPTDTPTLITTPTVTTQVSPSPDPDTTTTSTLTTPTVTIQVSPSQDTPSVTQPDDFHKEKIKLELLIKKNQTQIKEFELELKKIKQSKMDELHEKEKQIQQLRNEIEKKQINQLNDYPLDANNPREKYLLERENRINILEKQFNIETKEKLKNFSVREKEIAENEKQIAKLQQKLLDMETMMEIRDKASYLKNPMTPPDPAHVTDKDLETASLLATTEKIYIQKINEYKNLLKAENDTRKKLELFLKQKSEEVKNLKTREEKLKQIYLKEFSHKQTNHDPNVAHIIINSPQIGLGIDGVSMSRSNSRPGTSSRPNTGTIREQIIPKMTFVDNTPLVDGNEIIGKSLKIPTTTKITEPIEKKEIELIEVPFDVDTLEDSDDIPDNSIVFTTTVNNQHLPNAEGPGEKLPGAKFPTPSPKTIVSDVLDTHKLFVQRDKARERLEAQLDMEIRESRLAKVKEELFERMQVIQPCEVWKNSYRSRFLSFFCHNISSLTDRPIKSIAWLTDIIDDIYNAKYIADSELPLSNNIQNFPEFIFHTYMKQRFDNDLIKMEQSSHDIYKSVIEYADNYEVVNTFRQFLQEEKDVFLLNFYLCARNLLITKYDIHPLDENNNRFSLSSTGDIIDNLFQFSTRCERFDITQSLSINLHSNHPQQDKINIHSFLASLLINYEGAIFEFNQKVMRIYEQMGLETGPLNELIPIFRIIFSGLSEVEFVNLIGKLEFTYIGKQLNITHLLSICQSHQKIFRNGFMVPKFFHDSSCSLNLKNNILHLVESRWQKLQPFARSALSYIQTTAKDTLSRFAFLALDLNQHLNMSLRGKLARESLHTYRTLLYIFNQIFQSCEDETENFGPNMIQRVINSLEYLENTAKHRLPQLAQGTLTSQYQPYSFTPHNIPSESFNDTLNNNSDSTRSSQLPSKHHNVFPFPPQSETNNGKYRPVSVPSKLITSYSPNLTLPETYSHPNKLHLFKTPLSVTPTTPNFQPIPDIQSSKVKTGKSPKTLTTPISTNSGYSLSIKEQTHNILSSKHTRQLLSEAKRLIPHRRTIKSEESTLQTPPISLSVNPSPSPQLVESNIFPSSYPSRSTSFFSSSSLHSKNQHSPMVNRINTDQKTKQKIKKKKP